MAAITGSTADVSTNSERSSAGFDDFDDFEDMSPTDVDTDSSSTLGVAFDSDLIPAVAVTPNFSCDDTQQWSQMRSCIEILYFIQRCSNTKMNDDNDAYLVKTSCADSVKI